MKTPYNWAKRDRLRSLLRMLDFEVTGKNETYKSHQDFPEDFELGGVEYYLSDGGYSRVCFNDMTGKLFMTSNSTDQAKKQFERLSLLRGIIETFSLCRGEEE